MPTIDERIVEMQFDNKDFEKNVGQSIKSLDALKKSLQFEDSYDSLDKFAKSINKVDLSGIKDSIDDIGKHFTVVGRFIDRHIDGIIRSVETKLTGVLKSISVDQISQGFGKYETQTKAVQTITNATGKSVEEVEGVLGKLMKYTDETSYDFVEMANSIGKFTSVGVELERAEQAMEGIANVAAVSGAGKAEANRAMYNFAQALSQGKVQKIDWNSIANANMSTKEFKEELIKTAIALGTITKTSATAGKVISGSGKKAKETAVNYKTFESTLSEGWLTSDVLIETLNRYADTSTEIGDKSYKAAQKALTWKDAIDAIKDAVSSQWMTSFKHLFGNLDEAIDLWTNFCNAIIEVTGAIGDWRNNLLEGWHQMGGYNAMVETASNVWSVLTSVLGAAHDAFASVIPPLTSEKLVEMTERVRDITAQWKQMFGYVEEQDEEIRRSDEEYDELAKKIEKISGEHIIGDRGESVKEVQDILVSLGYLDEKFANGIFGDETKQAVKELQTGLGILTSKGTATGTFDDAVRDALLMEDALKNVDKTVESVTRKIGDMVTVEKEYTEVVNYANKLNTMLEKGRKNNQVKFLQENLIRLGYLDEGQADGIYGDKTEAAVKRLQKALGVEVTGAWDKATIRAARYSKAFEVTETRVRKVEQTVGAQNSTMEKVQNVMRGFAAAVSLVGTAFSFVGNVFGVVLKILSPVGSAILTIASAVSTCLVSLNEFVTENKIFENALAGIGDFLYPVWVLFSKFEEAVTNFFTDHADITTFTQLFSTLNETFKNSEIGKKLDEWKTKANDFLKSFGIDIPGIIGNFQKFGKNVKKIFDDLNGGKFKFKDFSKAWAGIGVRLAHSNDRMSQSIGKLMLAIRNSFKKILPKIKSFAKSVQSFFGGKFQKAISWAQENLPKIVESVKEFGVTVGKGILKGVVTTLVIVLALAIKAYTWVSEKMPIIIDKVKEFGETVKTSIGGKAKAAFEWLKARIPGIVNTLKELGDAITNFFNFGNKTKGTDSATKTLKDRFEDIKATVSNFVGKIKTKFKEFYDSSPFLQDAWAIISPILDNLKEFFANINLENIKNFFTTLKDSIANFFDKDTSDEDDPLAKLKKRFEELSPIIESFKGIVAQIKEAWENAMGLKDTLEGEEGIENTFTTFWNKLKGFFENIYENRNKLIIPAIAALGTYMLISGIKSMNNISKGLKGIGDALFLKSGGKKDTAGDTALKIAASIAAIAVAIGILSLIDFKDGMKGIGLFSALLVAWYGIPVLINKLSGGDANNDFGEQVKNLAIGLGIIVLSLAGLIAICAFTPLGLLIGSLTVLAVIITGLASIEILISKKTNGLKGAEVKGIVQLAIGLGIVVAAFAGMVAIVRKNSIGDLVLAFVGIEALLWSLGGIEILIAKSSKSKVKISGILSLALGLGIIVLAFKGVADAVAENKDAADHAFIIIEALLGSVGGLAALINNTSKGALQSIANAAMIVAMAWSVSEVATAFAEALNLVKDVSTTQMTVFFLGIDIAFGVLAGIVKAFGAMDVKTLVVGELGFVGLMAALSAGIAMLADVGSDAIEKFSTAMWVVGSKLGDFDAMVPQDLSKVKAACDILSDTIMPMLGSAAAYGVAYSDDANTFANKLYEFGSYIGLYAASISDVSTDASTAVKAMIDDAVEIMDTIAGIEKVSVVKSTLEDIGGALKLYYGNLAGLETEGVTVDSETIKRAFTALAEAAPDTALVQQISSFADNGSNNLGDFAIGITNLGTALERYGKDIGGLDKKQIGLANSVMSTVQTIQTRLNQVTWDDFLGILSGKRKTIEDFGEDIAALGTALGKYGTSVKDLDADDVTNSKNALDIVSELNSKLPTTGGILTFFTGDKKLGEFASNMSTLGDGVQQFANKVAEGKFDNVPSAMEAIKSLSDVFVSLDKTGGVTSWFNGDKDLSVLSKGLVKVGEDLVAIGGMEYDLDGVNDFIDIAGRIRDIQNSINWDTTNVAGFNSIVQSLKNALIGLANLNDVKVDKTWGFGGTNLFDAVSQILNGDLGDILSQLSTMMEPFTLTLTDDTTNLLNAMSTAISNDVHITASFGQLMTDAAGAVANKATLFEAAGAYIVQGLANGISNNQSTAINAAVEMAVASYEAACASIGVESPSKAFEEMGMYSDLGFANGLEEYASIVKSSATRTATEAVDGAKEGLASFSSLIIDDLDDTPVIRPVLDLSDVEAGASMLGSIFGTRTVGLRSSTMVSNIANAATPSNGQVAQEMRALAASLLEQSRSDLLSDVASGVTGIDEKIARLSDLMTNLQVVMETGALVGQIAPAMDRQLGRRASRANRGG